MHLLKMNWQWSQSNELNEAYKFRKAEPVMKFNAHFLFFILTEKIRNMKQKL